MKEKIAISACLLGANTKYTGGNNYREQLRELLKDKIIIPICPEVFGGLSTPRDPAEEKGDKVFTDKGKDVTNAFYLGAKRTLEFLIRCDCHTVILKEGSPSCGVNYSYDGTFTHTKLDNMGIATRLLKENGFTIIVLN